MLFYANLTTIFLFLASLILSSNHLISIALESEVDDESPFTYTEGTDQGPNNWSQIDPHWKACGHGKMQSPIDLLDRRVQVFPALGKLKRDYKAAPAVARNRGHDITVVWKGNAGEININGTNYKLQQCHWHSPSEHTFNGSRYELELHVVHLSSNGAIAVVGIVYKYGHPDPFLSEAHNIAKWAASSYGAGSIPVLFHHIKSVGEEEKDLGIVNPGLIKFGSRKYYRYIGSLTVPPCTEGVIWTMVKKVRTVSREQVAALREAVHDGFEANARPTQQSDSIAVEFYTPRVNGGST